MGEDRYKKFDEVTYTPDLECYTLVLQCFAKCVSREYTPMMDFLRQKMEHHSALTLTIDTYKIVLNALAHCTHDDAPYVSKRALDGLVAKYTNGDRNFENLSTEYFRLVLLSHANNVTTKASAISAQNTFDTLQQLHADNKHKEGYRDVFEVNV